MESVKQTSRAGAAGSLAVCVCTAILALVHPVSGEEQDGQPSAPHVALVLDASGSMNSKLPDGVSRFDAARSAVSDMLSGLPATTQVALRVYGHQSAPAEHNCEDTELLLPFAAAPQTTAMAQAKLPELSALGYTPISLSLQKAAEDLAQAGVRGGSIILISDGKETCKADPCALAKALANVEARLVIHTVGFGVDDATRRQLQCIANQARGRYFDAKSAAELTRSLNQAAAAKPAEPRAQPARAKVAPGVLRIEHLDVPNIVVTEASSQRAEGLFATDNSKELPPGIYNLELTNGRWTGIEVRSGQTTTLSPAYLNIEPKNPLGLVSFIDAETGEVLGESIQNTPQIPLVPGRYHVRFGETEGDPMQFDDVSFEEGKTVTLRPSLVRVNRADPAKSFVLRSLDGRRTVGLLENSQVSVTPGVYLIGEREEIASGREVTLKTGQVLDLELGE